MYNELKDNSRRAITRVIGISIGSSAFIYESIAILGYLSFGKDVRGNIIMECKVDSHREKRGSLLIVMV